MLIRQLILAGLLNKPNITEYRLLSEGVAYTVEIGPHGGGHYIIK